MMNKLLISNCQYPMNHEHDKLKSDNLRAHWRLETGNWKLSSAFTLLELLVVISIIGILVALSIFGLQGARVSARDARRKADLEQIKSALEIYKADCGKYPAAAYNPSATALTQTCLGTVNTYISALPDPVSGRNYSYNTTDSGITYYLCAALEQGGPGGGTCGSCTVACNYPVRNP
jgi:type II secretion system protein G